MPSSNGARNGKGDGGKSQKKNDKALLEEVSRHLRESCVDYGVGMSRIHYSGLLYRIRHGLLIQLLVLYPSLFGHCRKTCRIIDPVLTINSLILCLFILLSSRFGIVVIDSVSVSVSYMNILGWIL